MKTIILIIALATSLQAQDRFSRIGAFIGGNSAPDPEQAGRTVPLMDRLEGGKKVPTTAYLQDDLSVKITGRPPVAWEQAPASIREKLKPAYDRMLAKKNAKIDGLTELNGKIIGRTPKGFLIEWRELLLVMANGEGRYREAETLHIAEQTDLADGERWKGTVKRQGVYQYTDALGSLATVKNFVPVR